MALPIGKTPILKGEDAAKFIKELHSNADKPTGSIPTPKLAKAYKSIKEYAQKNQERIR